MKKRLVAFSLVLVLVLSLACTAFAAKPTVKLYKTAPTSVKRGKTITYYVEVNSQSYSAKNGVKRAQWRQYLLNSKKQKLVKGQTKTFTGVKRYKSVWTISSSATTGTYYYATDMWYRSSKAGAKWKAVTPGKGYFYKFKIKK